MARVSRLRWTTLLALVFAGLGLAGLVAVPADAGPFSSVSGVAVTISSPSSSAAALTSYVVTFQTSASGSLSGNAGGTVTLRLPSGTGLSLLQDHSSQVSVSGNPVGSCAATSATVITCTISPGDTVPASTSATVTLNGVTNPATANAYTLSLSTSSDATAVASPSYTVAHATKIRFAGTEVFDPGTGATDVDYDFWFKTATGLSGNSGSSIAITFPRGTSTSQDTDGDVVILNGSEKASCAPTSASVVTCSLFPASATQKAATIPAGASLIVIVHGITNPTTTKAYKLEVATTSDVEPFAIRYCIAARGVPCISAVTPSRGPAGQAATISGVNLAGATAVDFNGTAAAISNNGPGFVSTTVPTGATSGPVTVTTPNRTATSWFSFTVT